MEEDIRMAFEFFKNQFEIDESKYQAKIKGDIENGHKGGNPNFKKGKRNPYYKDEKITQDNPPLSKITIDNDNDNDNIKKTSSTTKQKKAVGDTPGNDGPAEFGGEAMPLQADTRPAAQKEKSCAKKEKAPPTAAAPAAQDAPLLGTDEIIAEIGRRAITAEQLAMANGLDAAGWQAVKAEIFAQWRFEGYRNTLQDALNHFANLVRKKACGKRNARNQGQGGSVEAMIAGMLATARTPEQETADDERFKQDFGL